MHLSHGWLSLVLMIFSGCVDKSQLLGIFDDVQYFNPWQGGLHSHITTNFSASKNHPLTLTKWFAALEPSFNKLFESFIYAFFRLPSLIGLQPAGCLPLFSSIFTFRFWWPAFNTWHRLVSQIHRTVWSSQRYAYSLFVCQNKGLLKKKTGVLISNNIIYMKINSSVSSAQRD